MSDRRQRGQAASIKEDENTCDLTALLRRWHGGDRSVESELMPILYFELKHLGVAALAGVNNPHELQVTELVHEAYLRLLKVGNFTPENRQQFFALAVTVIRRILVDQLRSQLAHRRGGNMTRISLEQAEAKILVDPTEVLELDQALRKLEAEFPESAKIAELRYFAGFDIKRIAIILNVSRATVIRRWRFAKASLRAELQQHD